VALTIDPETRLLVLTGAGVSAESGVPTFRDANGLWENHRVEDVATPQGFEADPALVWRFYSSRRRAAKSVLPNPGHLALAEAEARMGERFLLVTQNIDRLHQRAGSRRVLEIHGSLFETRCFRCEREPFADDSEHDEAPSCEACAAEGASGLLRPAVVWFGELIDPRVLGSVARFVAEARRSRLVFLAVGTAGAVYPAAGLVLEARAAGGETWLVNAEPAENRGAFHHFVQGPSGKVLPGLFDWV
jgi:NAD-dependent deacetylase